MEFIPMAMAAVGISAYDYFGNSATFLIGCALVVFALVGCFELLNSEDKNELLNFLFKAGMCGIFLCLSYAAEKEGRQYFAAKHRDFFDCLGGFLAVAFACFCFFGSIRIATLKINASSSRSGDDFC